MSRVRANRMHGSTGGSWKRSDPWQPTPAALGKPSDLSPASPTGRHLASSLPNQPPPRRTGPLGTSSARCPHSSHRHQPRPAPSGRGPCPGRAVAGVPRSAGSAQKANHRGPTDQQRTQERAGRHGRRRQLRRVPPSRAVLLAFTLEVPFWSGTCWLEHLQFPLLGGLFRGVRPADRAPWQEVCRDVTERQADGSQPVKVRSGETPGSPVVKPPASVESPASKRGGPTDRSAASCEA